MALPILNLTIKNELSGLPNHGELKYLYNPFYNLINKKAVVDGSPLKGLNLTSEEAGIDINKPIQLETEVCYDDTINLIISDQINPPKIVNSRFYQTDSSNYKIADRKGNLDTNIYSSEYFKNETSLTKTTRTISTLDFLGLSDGGKLPVGSYTFYFKLADADGNESDYISESGKIVCHIGGINSPTSIRGGILNEDSNKSVKLRLNNLDLSYDYINVYYTRTSGDNEKETTSSFKIADKFKITSLNTEFIITGYEKHEPVSLDDINIQYEMFNSAETIQNCQNISFVGNVTNDYELFSNLEKLSLFVTPSVVYDEEGIGNLDHQYRERISKDGYEYYNMKNTYYKLGYWDEEIYRFGIVYILNDYTLSPVFNIRGKVSIDMNTEYDNFRITDEINYDDNFIIQKKNKSVSDENVKGVFKIDVRSQQNMFNNSESIKPIGIKFNIHSSAFNGLGGFKGIKELTKGCFIVRQKRIPTILTQGIGIGTTLRGGIPVIKAYAKSENWITQSFVKSKENGNNLRLQKLECDTFTIPDAAVYTNALLSPEATLRSNIFNTLFNSSEFKLRPSKYAAKNKVFTNYLENKDSYSLSDLEVSTDSEKEINSELTLVNSGVERIRNNNYTFCTKAGSELIAYQHIDPILGNFEDPNEEEMFWENERDKTNSKWNTTSTKVRGCFNSFIGLNKTGLDPGRHYNIFQQGYNFELNWKNYFLVRYNDSSPFFPVTDRISWESNKEIIAFRGDCYINTVTQRMNWNFIDPELPTNKKIIDPFTWAKNFRIVVKENNFVNTDSVNSTSKFKYKKVLPLFTYSNSQETSFTNEQDDGIRGILEPQDKKYKKYSDINGVFGVEKINRPDVNAVPLGHWVTYKICTNVNLGLRDIDHFNPGEEALHKQKRSFYPLQTMDKSNNLPESNIINVGVSKSLGDKYYFEIPDVPFLKNTFTTRIYHSYPLQSSSFINGNRIFEKKNYQDYTLEHGSLVKLVEWFGSLIAVMEHGVMMIPVNERALVSNESGENVFINTDTVLPKNPKILSNSFGTLWGESIIKTSRFIYGIDTVAKKIWRTNGQVFEIISDFKVQRFLNENILLKESDKDNRVGVNFVKTHYNAFKQDVMFVFSYKNKTWNLCWSEAQNKWVTQYTWFPEFSENINNIFYTFAFNKKHKLAKNKLYVHGFAGHVNLGGEILPTKWYDEQHFFEFEFVVNSPQGFQKIYDNMNIISNNVPPDSFIYEITGDGYDWSKYKNLIPCVTDNDGNNDSSNNVIGFGKPFPWLL